MDVPPVIVQIEQIGESLQTERAAVRSFSAVDFHVTPEMSRGLQILATNGTHGELVRARAMYSRNEFTSSQLSVNLEEC